MTLHRGDIIQITEEEHDWYPCLLVVDEVKAWDVQAFAFIPHNDGTPTGRAYIRLSWNEFEEVGIGAALIVPAPDESEAK